MDFTFYVAKIKLLFSFVYLPAELVFAYAKAGGLKISSNMGKYVHREKFALTHAVAV